MNSSTRRYSRSPLTEALIDLRCFVDRPPTLDALAGVQESIKADYPAKNDLVLVQGRLTAGQEIGANLTQRLNGYLFVSADERQAFQARLDGFTFSRFAPYDCWATFRDEARRLWEAYRSAVEVKGVLRVATRYINRFDFPLPFDDLKDYLRTVPQVSSDLPQALSATSCNSKYRKMTSERCCR